MSKLSYADLNAKVLKNLLPADNLDSNDLLGSFSTEMPATS